MCERCHGEGGHVVEEMQWDDILTVENEPIELDSIEIYWINDDGKVYKVQTYFGPPEGRTLDPFFSKKEI